ncbi:glycoside hydrolase family 5 protein [Umbelopsis sp. PMI_123]|nr:glycoside hydrolase family 5 protein [Umbelopsis sp. PMI_123]
MKINDFNVFGAVLAIVCSNLIGVSANSFAGASSYFLYTLQQSDRIAVLDAMQAAGLKTLRIFVTQVAQNIKGCTNSAVNDVEVGTTGNWDDTILQMIDILISEAMPRGIKLIIAPHDRYALGCWQSDVYVAKYNIPPTDCSTAANNASIFYTNTNAIADYDKRLLHILSHKYTDGTPWSQLTDGIFAFNIQNEAMGHMDMVDNQVYGGVIVLAQSEMHIYVSTGGGAYWSDSLNYYNFYCTDIDIIDIHSYDGTSAINSNMPGAINTANQQGKLLMMEEWGVTGDDSTKASGMTSQINALNGYGVPWSLWEVVKPSSTDFETFTDETQAWSAITTGAKAANRASGAFTFNNLP